MIRGYPIIVNNMSIKLRNRIEFDRIPKFLLTKNVVSQQMIRFHRNHRVISMKIPRIDFKQHFSRHPSLVLPTVKFHLRKFIRLKIRLHQKINVRFLFELTSNKKIKRHENRNNFEIGFFFNVI